MYNNNVLNMTHRYLRVNIVAVMRQMMGSRGPQDNILRNMYRLYIHMSRVRLQELQCSARIKLYFISLYNKNDKFTVYRIFPAMGVAHKPFIYTR